ncbi:MAG TPA: hypothetical protein VNG29_00680 [Candidatus Paceibacterota bacterium]|nr:hypothetical protein [Candidatus Paceibacterota bacterium]
MSGLSPVVRKSQKIQRDLNAASKALVKADKRAKKAEAHKQRMLERLESRLEEATRFLRTRQAL